MHGALALVKRLCTLVPTAAACRPVKRLRTLVPTAAAVTVWHGARCFPVLELSACRALSWTLEIKLFYAMNAPPNHPPDPSINLLQHCPGYVGKPCGQRMSPLRIYLGHGTPSAKHKRGSLVQVCNFCHRPEFHTIPYKFDDAERLLKRIIYPGDPSGLPCDLRPPTPPVATPSPPRRPPLPTLPVVSTQSESKVYCGPECKTLAGTLTVGSKTCIEHKCSKCCSKASHQAETSGIARSQCKAHKQPEIQAAYWTMLQAQGNPSPPSQPLSVTTEPTKSMSLSQPGFNAPVPTHPAQPPATQRPTRPLPDPGRTIPLARPMGGAWADKYDGVIHEQISENDLKSETKEIEDRIKKTRTLVVYHTEGEQPFRRDHYIPTFPHLRLSTCTRLIQELDLTPDTWIDFWHAHEWMTVDINTVLSVDKCPCVLLKIRPTIRNSLKNCPGLDGELKLPSKTQSAKRSGTALVSPIKKVQRGENISNVHTNAIQAVNTPALAHSPAPTPALEQGPLPAFNHTNFAESSTSGQPRTQNLAGSALSDTSTKPKQWPFDFYIFQIHNGLTQMQTMLPNRRVNPYQEQQRLSSRAKQKAKKFSGVTVKKAFQSAFPGTKFVSTTYYDHLKIWFAQDLNVRELFIELGESDQATYRHFLDALDKTDTTKKSGKRSRRSSTSSSGSNDSDSSSSASASASGDNEHYSGDTPDRADSLPLNKEEPTEHQVYFDDNEVIDLTLSSDDNQ
ncbi:hypothetical protein BJ912DRAFT_929195 [Pholiota molesta]|nr:hypothetical protein BJ912DRAFT_929195 [Pholiota molesta]